MSLAFEVVIEAVNGEGPPDIAVAGMPACGSKGVTVFAPEIPKT